MTQCQCNTAVFNSSKAYDSLGLAWIPAPNPSCQHIWWRAASQLCWLADKGTIYFYFCLPIPGGLDVWPPGEKGPGPRALSPGRREGCWLTGVFPSSTFTHNMLAFGLNKKLCNDFLKKQAVIGNLDEGESRQRRDGLEC